MLINVRTLTNSFNAIQYMLCFVRYAVYAILYKLSKDGLFGFPNRQPEQANLMLHQATVKDLIEGDRSRLGEREMKIMMSPGRLNSVQDNPLKFRQEISCSFVSTRLTKGQNWCTTM